MEPVDIRLELLYHYPWLPSLKNKISHLSKEDPIKFIEKTFDNYNPEEVKARILSFFKAAFDNLE
ncbi:MAG: hypothetical protein GF353_19020, partial [Candidatus Lokiarchaeota archaeon]|nr:hypothetical protein [Candidatus Lokiarchaeota archaeon]